MNTRGNSAAGPDQAIWMRDPQMILLRQSQPTTWRDHDVDLNFYQNG